MADVIPLNELISHLECRHQKDTPVASLYVIIDDKLTRTRRARFPNT